VHLAPLLSFLFESLNLLINLTSALIEDKSSSTASQIIEETLHGCMIDTPQMQPQFTFSAEAHQILLPVICLSGPYLEEIFDSYSFIV
jgi:hypothetical protein